MANDVWATIASAVAATDTTINLTAGQGARFPALTGGNWFYVTIFDATGNKERCQVTAVVGDTLTVSRGADGSTARAFAVPARVEMHWVAGVINDLQTQITAAVIAKLNQYFPNNITMVFSGALTAIPTGWQLCNGQNGTPNLSEQFIVGAGNLYAVGATGGTLITTLTAANLPAHNHTLTDPQHSHGITQTPHGHGYNASPHSHYFSAYINGAGGGGTFEATQLPGNSNFLTSSASYSGISMQASSVGVTQLASSTTGLTSANTGNGVGGTLLPPYYALAYICKVANWS